MTRLFTIIPMLALLVPACVEMDMDSGQETAFAESSAQISLEWLIVSGDQLISCPDAGASQVEIAILGTSEVRQTTSCFGGFAVLDAQSEGMSMVEVSLIAPNGDRLVTVDFGEVELVPGATMALGEIELKL